MQLTPDISSQGRLQRWSVYLALAIALIATMTLAGWQFDIPWLRRPLLRLPSMNPVSAIAFLFSAISFMLLARTKKRQSQTMLAIIFAVIVLSIGSVKMLHSFAGLEFEIDTLFFSDALSTDLVSRGANRMAPNTAIGFICIGFCLLALHVPRFRVIVPVHIIVVIMALLGLVALLGYLYGVEGFTGVLSYIPMAAHTAFCFLLFALCILFHEPGRGVMREFTSAHTGSSTARLLLPAAILIPVILGLSRLYGHWSKSITMEFGVTVLVTSIIVAFVIMIWYTAYLLNRKDLQRFKAQQQISRLGRLVEQTSDAIFSTDAELVINSWNKAAEEMYGYTAQEAIGKNLSSLLNIRNGRETHQESLAHLQLRGFYRGEYEASHSSGETVYVHVSISTLRNEYGVLTGYVAVHQDITEKRKVEQLQEQFNSELTKQVEEKTALLNSVLERVSDGFYSLDENWRFTYINSFAAEIMQNKPGDLIGKHIWTLYPDSVGTETYIVFNEAFAQQEHRYFEFYYEPYDKWFMVHAYPSPSGLSVFFRDVSEVRRAESEMRRANERFDLISRTTYDAIWEWNLETNEMWGNVTHQELYGLTMADPVPDETEWQQRIHPDDRQAMIKKQADTLASKSNVFITEYRFRTEKKGYRNIYDRCYIVRDSEGKAIRILGSMMDITERKQAEEKLKRREAQLLASIENTPNVAVQWFSDRGEVQFWNHASELIYGWGASEALGKTLDQLIYTEEQNKHFISLLSHISTTGQTIGPSEFSFNRKDGSPGNCLATIFSIPSIGGEPCFVRMDVDITESKKAAELLQRSEERYRALVDNSVEALVVMDMDKGTFVNVSESAVSLFKMTREELMQVGPLDLSPEFQPDGRLSSESAKDKLKRAIEGEKPSFEWTHRNKEGTLIPCEVRLVKLPAGKQVLIRGSIIDITERKKSEEAIKNSEETRRLIMNAALDAIVCVDMNSSITVWTPQAERIFGWSEKEVIGKNLTSTIIPGKYKERHLQGMKRYVETGEGPVLNRIVEISAADRNGREFPVELTITPIRQGGVEFFCAFIRDITERKDAQEKLVKEKLLSDTAINSLPGIFYMLDMDRKFLRWNRNFEMVSGYTAEEIPHIIPAMFFAEEDRPLVRQKVDEIFTKGSSELEAHFLTKQGEKIPYYLTGLAISYEGKPCMLGTGIDIGLLRKTQEDYNAIVNTIDGIVWEADAQTFRFSFVSKQAERLLGYPVERWLEEPGFWSDHIHPEDREWAVNYCLNSTAEMKPHEFEYRMMAEDGRVVWLRDIVSVAVEGGRPVRLRGIMIDITEKKKSEEEIVKTNARFQIMSKATSDIVWDWNVQDNALWSNDNYYSNLGYKKTREIVNIEERYQHIHPDDLDRVLTGLNEAINGTASGWREEYRYRRSDGEYLDILDRAYIMRDSNNKAYRMIGSMVDMSPIYEVQKKIADSESRLRTILDTDPECIKLLDPDCNLLEINKAGLQMLETDSADALLGKCLLSVVAEKYREETAELVTNAFRDRGGRLEFELITLKGGHRWCEVNMVPFKDVDGKIISALGVTRDITEQKQAELELLKNEEKYRTLVEQAVDAIALYDAKGKILDVNTGSVNLLGYSKEELIGMSLKEILTEEEIRENPVRYDVLQQGNSTVKQRKMRRKDGTIIETEVRSQQLPDGRFLSVIRDLTERIKAERELTASYDAIRKLTEHLQNIREEERTNIAREIHDELGQQLTVLKMDISWLKKKIGASDENVNRKIKDLLSMLDDTVRTVRRISSELRPSLLDDLGLIAAMEWHLREFEQRSGIKTIFRTSEYNLQLPDGIRTGLYRIFQESLTNVARHAGAENVEVTFDYQHPDIILRIIDDGSGFSKKMIENKRTLGILGMKERTAMMGGKYEIESEPGKGTVVVVTVAVNTNEALLN
jgi:PAS domain S-box-containing protein